MFPAIPLTPVPATASRHGGEDAVGGSSAVPDLSREGPFDIHQDNPRSVASPQLLQDTQGCPFRMRVQMLHRHMIWSPAPRSACAGVRRCFGMTDEL